MDLERVLEGLTDAAKAISGLTCYPFVPDSVEVPCFYTADVTVDFEMTFGNQPDVTVVCRVLTGRTDDRAGQKQLLRLMANHGPMSIKAALEAAKGDPGQYALDGACDDFNVRRVTGHRVYTVGEKPYYGADWAVHIIGDGDGVE